MIRSVSVSTRHWRKWKEYLHQTNEDYPWRRIHRWGQEELRQTGLSEHLHVHAVDGPSHGDTQCVFLWSPEPGTERLTAPFANGENLLEFSSFWLIFADYAFFFVFVSVPFKVAPRAWYTLFSTDSALSIREKNTVNDIQQCSVLNVDVLTV